MRVQTVGKIAFVISLLYFIYSLINVYQLLPEAFDALALVGVVGGVISLMGSMVAIGYAENGGHQQPAIINDSYITVSTEPLEEYDIEAQPKITQKLQQLYQVANTAYEAAQQIDQSQEMLSEIPEKSTQKSIEKYKSARKSYKQFLAVSHFFKPNADYEHSQVQQAKQALSNIRVALGKPVV